MSSDYDIEMSLDDTLELDAIIQEWSNISGVITKVEHTSDSTSHKDNIKGIQTNTAIFNPPKSGKYNITVNSCLLTVNVTDPSSIPSSVVYDFETGDVSRWENVNNLSSTTDRSYQGAYSGFCGGTQSGIAWDGKTPQKPRCGLIISAYFLN